MSWSRGGFRRGWSALPGLTRTGWVALGAGLLVTLTLGAPLLGTGFGAGLLAVLVSLTLALGLVTLIERSGSMGPRLAVGGLGTLRGGGAFGRVPASWEYYETFGG